MVNILNDGLLHFGAGVALSWADYATYRAIHRKTDRMERKTACLESIDLLLDADSPELEPAEAGTVEKNPSAGKEKQAAAESGQEKDVAKTRLDKGSVQYALNVDQVKNYFIEEGVIKKDLPFSQKLKHFFRSLLFEERLNNLSAGGKLIFATAAEFLYDSLFGIRYYTQVRKESPLASLANNIYQIPAFFAGLWLGNLVKKGFDWFRSSDEKKIDRTINKLVRNTDIVDLVLTYSPPDAVKTELEKQGVRDYAAKLTSAGRSRLEKMGKNVQELVYKMTHVRELREKKHEEESRKIRSRFEEIVAMHEKKNK